MVRVSSGLNEDRSTKQINEDARRRHPMETSLPVPSMQPQGMSFNNTSISGTARVVLGNILKSYNTHIHIHGTDPTPPAGVGLDQIANLVAEVLGAAYRQMTLETTVRPNTPQDIVLDMMREESSCTIEGWQQRNAAQENLGDQPSTVQYSEDDTMSQSSLQTVSTGPSTHSAISQASIDLFRSNFSGGFFVPENPASFFVPGRVYAELFREYKEQTTQGAELAPTDLQIRYMVVIRQARGNHYDTIPILKRTAREPYLQGYITIYDSRKKANRHPGEPLQGCRPIRVVMLPGQTIDDESRLNVKHVYARTMGENGAKVMEIGQIMHEDIVLLQREIDKSWRR